MSYTQSLSRRDLFSSVKWQPLYILQHLFVILFLFFVLYDKTNKKTYYKWIIINLSILKRIIYTLKSLPNNIYQSYDILLQIYRYLSILYDKWKIETNINYLNFKSLQRLSELERFSTVIIIVKFYNSYPIYHKNKPHLTNWQTDYDERRWSGPPYNVALKHCVFLFYLYILIITYFLWYNLLTICNYSLSTLICILYEWYILGFTKKAWHIISLDTYWHQLSFTRKLFLRICACLIPKYVKGQKKICSTRRL